MTILHLDASITGENSASRAISRSIVEAHEGRIWAENAGRGATFHVSLPSRMRAPASAASSK